MNASRWPDAHRTRTHIALAVFREPGVGFDHARAGLAAPSAPADGADSQLSGVGMAYQVTPGTYAAIRVGAIRPRLDDERREWIAGLMKEALQNSGWGLIEGDNSRAYRRPHACSP